MHYHVPRPFFILLSLCAVVAATTLTGCKKPDEEPAGRLSTPSKGTVRIVATKIEDTPSKVHWKWSVIGERNWGGAKAGNLTEGDVSGPLMELVDPFPINESKRRKGCNVWELDLEASRSTGGKATWKATLHGSDGTTTEQSGEEPLSVEVRVGEVIRVRQTSDAAPTLPATLTVAQIGRKALVFRVAK